MCVCVCVCALPCMWVRVCVSVCVFNTMFIVLMGVCNEWHSFHARVGRFSPFLYLRSVAIAVILFWLQLVVLVSPCFLGSRIPRDYRFPPAPLFLCSERKPSSLTTGSSKLQFGDKQTRVKTVHYSEDRNSRCDAT